jgi:hypothetical protein
MMPNEAFSMPFVKFELVPIRKGTSTHCPHCGALNIFPSFSAMYAATSRGEDIS